MGSHLGDTTGDRGLDAVRLVITHLEADRERVARYLHDEPLQALCVSLLRLQMLQRGITESQAAELGRVIDVLRDAIVQIQGLQTELYPTALELLDLEALVREDLGRMFPDRAEPSTGHWSPGALPSAARLTLLRMLREVCAAAATAGAAPRTIEAISQAVVDAADEITTTTTATTTVTIEFGIADQRDPTSPGEPTRSTWPEMLDRSYLDARAGVSGGSIDVEPSVDGVRVHLVVAG